MFSQRIKLGVAGMLALVLGGCITPPPVPVLPEGAPPDFPADKYTGAERDAQIYTVASASSLVTVKVYRGGTLSRLGHDHVIAARRVEGYAALKSAAGGATSVQADLYAALGDMSVDEAALRAAAGFATEPSEDDKQGTRANMLKSLDAGSFPFVQVALAASIPARGAFEGEVEASVSVRLHGVEQAFRVPVAVSLSNDEIHASGSFEIAQTDFDIEPFSVMGGALAVKDELEIDFLIQAR